MNYYWDKQSFGHLEHVLEKNPSFKLETSS